MKTIIEMTRELGGFAPTTKFLEHFAALVRADEREACLNAMLKSTEKAVDMAITIEREACAKLCDVEEETAKDEGVYPLYTQTETGCAECGIGGGHALYCVACAEVALKNWVGYGEGFNDACKRQPERPWVGLTEEEVIEISHLALTRVQAVQMTQAKLKEKNT